MLPQEPCLHHILELRPQGLLSRQRGANRLHQANQVLDVQGNTGNASGMLLEYDGIWWNMMEYDGIWWNMMDWMWILWLNANSENKSKEYPQQQHLYMKKSTHVCRNDVWELFEINREKTFDWPSVGNNKNFAWTPVPGHLACSAVLAAPKLTLLGKKSWRDVQSMEWWSSMTFHVSSSKCADWDIFRHNSKHRPLPQWSDAKCLLP